LCIKSDRFEVRRTDVFIDWLSELRDAQARARIAKRINRLADGNFGDAKSVGDGVSELRFAFGPGYRVYYTRRGAVVVILLCGGDKDTQERDIERAKVMALEID
jgi:putative addiction module killer protein